MGFFRRITSHFFPRQDLPADRPSVRTQKQGRARLMAQIRETKTAHGKLAVELDTKGSDTSLGRLAAELRRLPKVMPALRWREQLRGRLVAVGLPHWSFRLLERGMAVAVVIFLVGGVFATSFLAQVPATLAEAGRIVVHDGEVLLRDPGETFFETVVGEDTVYAGSAVRVSPGGSARLSLLDDSHIDLEQNTEVTIAAVAESAQPHEQPEVRVAVISGEVSASPAEPAGRLPIDTPSGTVSAPEGAMISVASSGEAEVTSDTAVVVTLPTGDAELVPAGQSARIAAGVVELLPPPEVAPLQLDLANIATRIDIAQIRMFDALILAQRGDTAAATVLEQRVVAELAAILDILGISDITERRAAVLSLALGTQMPAEYVATTEVNLALIADVQTLLAYYRVSPELLTGVPAFELLAVSDYEPSTQARRLFAAVRTAHLARATAQTESAQLVQHTVGMYMQSLSASQLSALMSELQTQLAYLPALQYLADVLPEDHIAHARAQRAIAQLVAVRAAYTGESI